MSSTKAAVVLMGFLFVTSLALMFRVAVLETQVYLLKQSTADAWHFLQKYEERFGQPMGKFESSTNFNPSPWSTMETNLTEWIVFEDMHIDVNTNKPLTPLSNSGTPKP